jgi:hypothetical protein
MTIFDSIFDTGRCESMHEAIRDGRTALKPYGEQRFYDGKTLDLYECPHCCTTISKKKEGVVYTLTDLEQALSKRKIVLSRLRLVPQIRPLWRAIVEDGLGAYRGEGRTIQEAITDAIDGYDRGIEETEHG